MSNFLESKTAVGLYAKLAFEAKGNAGLFNQSWHEILEENGVTITQDVNEDDIIPKKIIGAIETAVLQDVVFAQFNLYTMLRRALLLLKRLKTSTVHGVIRTT